MKDKIDSYKEIGQTRIVNKNRRFFIKLIIFLGRLIEKMRRHNQ